MNVSDFHTSPLTEAKLDHVTCVQLMNQYADGFAYSKHKMEEAFRPGGFLDKPPAKSPHVGTKDASAPPKREDVDLIVCSSVS